MPPAPIGTTTRLGTIWFLTQLRFDASGRVEPVGYATRKVDAVVLTTVTLRTAASAPTPGMPPAPLTWTSIVAPCPRWWPAFVCPLPVLVSVMRAGLRGTKPPSVPPLDGA